MQNLLQLKTQEQDRDRTIKGAKVVGSLEIGY